MSMCSRPNSSSWPGPEGQVREKGSGPTYRAGVPRARVLDARAALAEALTTFQSRADADLAAALQQELLACVDRYETLKSREGALDFFDLLMRARDLVKEHEDVRRHFQQRFRHIFVDEFRTPIPYRPNCFCCSRLATRASPRGATSIRCRESSSSSAIPNSPSTDSGGPTSGCSARCVTSCSHEERCAWSCARAFVACRTSSAP